MKIVLHICCGVCAAGAAERLTSEGHQILGFFYNPNIHPVEEYSRRLEATYKVARELNFPLTVPAYEAEEWFKEISSLEKEPEGGKRCQVCFRLRLKKTYLYSKDLGWEAFTTSLTAGSAKPTEIINRIGQEISQDKFLVSDFKKKEGSKRAMELAKQWTLYRQNYCGCVYSQREKKTSNLST